MNIREGLNLMLSFYKLYQLVMVSLHYTKVFITTYGLSNLVITLILFFFASVHVHAEEVTSQNLQAPTLLTEADIFKQAKSLASSNQEKSIELANQAIALSKRNNNQKISAQAHVFLGKIAQKNKNIDISLQHFLQASSIYENIQDTQKQISTSLSYVPLLFAKKDYENAYTLVDDLLVLSQENNINYLTALSFMTKGNGYYQQKNYNQAISEYSLALKFFDAPDKATQKKRGETYKKMAEVHKRLKNREATASFYREALSVFTLLQDKKNMARTLNTLAEAERYLGNYETALDYSIKGLAIHEEINDEEGQAKALMGSGIIYRYIGRYEKSLNSIYRAHLIYKKMKNIIGIAKTSNEMGLLYTRLKEFKLAKSFYQLTLDLPENKVESKTLATAYRELAVIDLSADDYLSARDMAKKAYDIYQKSNEKSKASLTARIIANTYRDQKDRENAAMYYRISLSLAETIGSKIYQMKAQIPLAAIIRDEAPEESIRLLKSALKLAIETNDKSHQLYTFRELRRVEKDRGNISASLDYAEKEILLSKEIHEESEAAKLALEKAKLYSHKIEIELESLKEKAQLDQLALEKQTTETEMAEQARKISELSLTKNRYASIALASLLAACFLVAIYIYSRFINSNKRNKELDYLAARDPLTNCYNRRILFEFMNRDFTNLEELKEYCIILADIDHFKSVNDTYGHSKGDTVLCAAANILTDNMRKNDIVARFGGEEFCIVLPSTSTKEAMKLAENLRLKIESQHFDEISMTCSFGVTSIEFSAKTPRELIDQADLALFKSKDNGRNLVTLWSPDIHKA